MKNQFTLKQAFIEHSTKHGDATEEGNPATANTEYDKIVETAKEINNLGSVGVATFKELISHSNLSVVAAAAYYLLPYCEEEARKALIKVDKNATPLVAFSASMVLQEWDAGRLRII